MAAQTLLPAKPRGWASAWVPGKSCAPSAAAAWAKSSKRAALTASTKAVRDPRDAVECVRAWVLLVMLVMLVLLVRLVRLAQAPLGESAAGRNLRSGLVARARRQQADCVGRGVVTAAGANTHPEARWLAGEPA